MKIINQTPEEMTLSHPSTFQTIAGGVLMLISAVLFIFSTSSTSNALLASHTAFVFFGIGILVLFMNATHVIDINKTANTIRIKRRTFLGATYETYNTTAVDHVEVRPRHGRPFSEAFLILRDGVHVLIDYERRTQSETSIATRVAQFLDVPLTIPHKT